MGYTVLLRSSSAVIEASNAPAALAAIRTLLGQETCGPPGEKHFSFVRTSSFLNADSLANMLVAWRWVAEVAEDGSTAIVDFLGSSFGDEDLLFATLAPFVRAGGHIDMMGEDGALWRWLFRDGAVYILTATVTFPEPTEDEKWEAGRPWLWMRRPAE